MAQQSQVNAVSLRWPIWLGVVCENLEQQRCFYRDVLGLTESRSGQGWVSFDFDGRVLELLAKSELPQYDRRRVSFAFEVDHIHVARAELQQRGIEPVSGVEGGAEAQQYWAYFRDSEGNLFEIVQRIQ
jgi:extradiol dioxygenase family protein